jgi:hypothetical protein
MIHVVHMGELEFTDLSMTGWRFNATRPDEKLLFKESHSLCAGDKFEPAHFLLMAAAFVHLAGYKGYELVDGDVEKQPDADIERLAAQVLQRIKGL